VKDYYPGTKVIIMTAYGSSEVHEEANARGCFKYIEKPFEINDLRKLILEAIEEKKGFRGTVTDFHLSDLIQMNCLGRMTSALNVTREERNGIIYFNEGNVVHAECDGLEGEEAILEMLSWAGGQFSSIHGKTAPKETIIKGWQSLLLEAMRRLDESKPRRKLNQEEEREIVKNKIMKILDRLIMIKGTILVTVFDPEGFPLASKINNLYAKKYNIRELTPILSNLLKHIDTSGKELKIERVQDLMVEFKDALLKITRIKDKKEFLVILTKETKNQGILILESKKHLRLLDEIL
jgi:predicted regulator of Ras-like GTPase activity (Roadblock/LC7/MglB family)